MRRRELLALLGGVASWPMAASAQQTDRLPRIGTLLSNTAEKERAFFGDDPFGLRDVGYIEGKNILIERRFADGHSQRLQPLAAELVASSPDLIVAGGEGAYWACRATSTIPIVMASGPDMVELGFAASLAHPGGNVTGTTFSIWEVFAKRMEVLKQVAPLITNIGMLMLPGGSAEHAFTGLMVPAAKALNLDLRPIEMAGSDYAAALAAAEPLGGLVIYDVGQFQGDAAIIAAAAIARRLPTAASPFSAKAGALIGYGVDFEQNFRRAGVFVDKILKGAKPGDIPIERANRFHTTINLATARALGLDIPPLLLAAADEVIE
jgi:putative ABC transport system substrate-binding protein